MEKKIKAIILNKGQTILRILIILSPILVGILLWDRLPDRIATHFGMDGTPNGWSDKVFAVFGLPLILLVIQFLCSAVTLADPKRERINAKMMNLVLWIIPIVSVVCNLATYGYALKLSINIEKVVMVMVGVIFLLIGNYMPKCKQNYSMGIKVAWTLASENNWNHTHRFAGWIYVAAGIAAIIAGMIGFIPTTVFVFIVLLAAFLPILYSFIYYLKNKQ